MMISEAFPIFIASSRPSSPSNTTSTTGHPLHPRSTLYNWRLSSLSSRVSRPGNRPRSSSHRRSNQRSHSVGPPAPRGSARMRFGRRHGLTGGTVVTVRSEGPKKGRRAANATQAAATTPNKFRKQVCQATTVHLFPHLQPLMFA